ncbi:MAG TPA: CHAD domain-containing protein [Terriglobales bacterium]|jgi:CHAD domain-containing protein|nr:CHAD domain-containing protein [Terriglobales bacterium]
MPIDLKRSRQAFQRLGRELAKLAKSQAPESVHKFRTNSRRVEALLSEVAPELKRNDKKLLKLLSRLRKKAGQVRDLDVEIASLRNLKIPEGNGHKSQFVDALVQERAKREQKLAKAFDRQTAAKVRKRLTRAADEIVIPKNAEPLTLTLAKLAKLGREHVPLTEKTLHQYRIIGKRARYIAELADHDSEAKRVVDQLKHMQDVIGDWHDWLKLTERAEALFGGMKDSALVAMLRNVTQAKFRQSVDAVAETRAAISNKKADPVHTTTVPSHKPSTATIETIAAVA